MTFTQEQLINQAREEVAFWRERDELIPSQQTAIRLRLAEITLAAMTAEPVAYMYQDGDDVEYNGHNEFSDGGRGVPLYAAPPAPVVPDGYALVPVDMAPEMMRAVQLNSELGGYAAANLSGAYSLFREFLAVACRAAGKYPAIPDGYVLAPIEPTAEMCDVKHVGVDVYTGIAADEYYSIGGEDAAKIWKAMLAAAPKPEVNREMD